MVRRLLQLQITRFLITGGMTTAVDLMLFTLLFWVTDFHVGWINIISSGVGIVIGFYLNRHWTFTNATARSHKRLWIASIVGYVGLAMNTALVILLAMFLPALVAKCFAILLMIIYNYTMQKKFVFRA